MADSQSFVAVAEVLARQTSLNDLQARGLVRRLLKDAGLSADEVTARQLAAVGNTLLAPALVKQGVAEPDRVRTQWLEACAKLEAAPAPVGPRTNATNTVEEVFARMGLRR